MRIGLLATEHAGIGIGGRSGEEFGEDGVAGFLEETVSNLVTLSFYVSYISSKFVKFYKDSFIDRGVFR